MANEISDAAVDLYLEGQKLYSIITRAQLEAAIDKFKLATEDSPQFARAWGHLAYATAQIVVAGHEQDKAAADVLLSAAREHALEAVGLDPGDYANHWDLAFVLLNQGDIDAALAEYEHALDLFDNNTDKVDRRKDFLVEMAEAHVYAGNTARADELLSRAQSVPDWHRWIRAWASFNARDYAGAIGSINEMKKPYNHPAYVADIQLLLAAAHVYNGQPVEAAQALERLKERRPDWTLDRELARNPFRYPADREHWEQGMRLAGFA